MSHATPSAARRGGTIATITAVVLALTGLYLAIGGVWLAVIGGSLYYVIAGVVLLATAVLLHRGQRAALLLYALLLVGTMIWAIGEVGFDFWSLAPRGDVLVPLGVWLLLPVVWRGLAPRRTAPVAALGLAVLASILVVGVALTGDPKAISGTLAAAPATVDASRAPAAADWTAYGGTNDGDRFSSLAQITPANVGGLKLAWQFRTGDTRGPNDPVETTDEDTPLKVGDTVYVCSPHDIVFALDAATGKLRWKFDPKITHDATFQHMTCRGVSYHATGPGAVTADGTPAPTDSPHRLYLPTNDGHLFAIDADTGALVAGFGQGGRIDLREGSEDQVAGRYMGTSPPISTDKVLVMGGAVIDNYSLHVPSGVIRGFDPYSGKLLWVFDAGNHDPNEMPSATHHFTAGSPNMWITGVADEKLGLVYIPLGTGANDIWGGTRSPDEERYDSALVALDLATGKLRWSYQNVHHDLWDMDMPSQPSLVDLHRPDGSVEPAIYAPAKTGNIFVLDRADGHLIVPAPETPVPGGAAPGDHLSPTQPFSALSFRPRHKMTGADMWGGSTFDELACRIIFHTLRYDGPFTPPTVGGDIVFPGDLGMFEWGGIAVDPAHQIAIANPISIPFVQNLRPRGPNNPAAPNASHPPGTETGTQPMYGAPFGVTLNALLSPIGLPCLAPPWGEMAAIDLRTNRIVWRHRIGTTQDEAPFGLALPVGVPMLGGPLLTAGGVTFISSTMDDYIRALDARTGRLLWEDRLPAGGQSTPMSYAAGGRQYVLTVDGGHGSFGTKLGDFVRAYALPN